MIVINIVVYRHLPPTFGVSERDLCRQMTSLTTMNTPQLFSSSRACAVAVAMWQQFVFIYLAQSYRIWYQWRLLVVSNTRVLFTNWSCIATTLPLGYSGYANLTHGTQVSIPAIDVGTVYNYHIVRIISPWAIFLHQLWTGGRLIICTKLIYKYTI